VLGLGVLGAGEPDLGDRGVVPARAGNVVLHGVLVALDQVVVVGSVGGALLETDRAGVLGLVSLVSLGGLGGRGNLLLGVPRAPRPPPPSLPFFFMKKIFFLSLAHLLSYFPKGSIT